MTFSARNYRGLKTALKNRYAKEIKLVIPLFKKSPSLIGDWLQDHKTELNEHSSLKWFFLQQLKAFQFFYQAQPQLSRNSFGDLENEVFERWNKSEFAENLLQALNKGSSLAKSSEKTLKLLDQHLVSLGNRHILKSDKVSRHYKSQVALGDTVKSGKTLRLLETVLHLEGKELGLMTSTMKEMKDFSQKIEVALKVIRKHSPSSWERFVAFTDQIVPISQKEFVSYSHQELPGVSMINLYDRDFVDLMDDLIHENGHHHLNYFLNLGKLISEPLDEIYYSPWRRTPRPLRGIYHAYFTFFWAFKLFSDLASAKEIDSIWYLFSAREKEKVHWRAIEEYYMLEYSFLDLKSAYQQGLISRKGWELISAQRRDVARAKSKILLWEKKLKLHRADLKKLKTDLSQASKHYRLLDPI